MRSLKFFIILAVLVFVPATISADHYSNDTAQIKWEKLESGLVLISAERKKKLPERQPFNKFLKNAPEKPPKPEKDPGDFGMGTGFFIAENIIVTNYHVIDGSDEIQVWAYDHPFAIKDVTVLGYDKTIDIAVIKINEAIPYFNPEIMKWKLDKPNTGDNVWALGHGLGQFWSLTKGIISTTYRSNAANPVSFVHYYQTDAVINQGNSGGPLFDEQGHVVGVNTLIIGPEGFYVGYGYAIPSILAKAVVDEIIDDGKFDRPNIGIQMGLLDDKEAYYDIRDLGYYSLLQIEGVTAKSPAKDAGIKKGDVVVSFDGTKITGAPDIIEILWKKDPGDVVDVEVYRDKKIIKLELKLGTYKEK